MALLAEAICADIEDALDDLRAESPAKEAIEQAILMEKALDLLLRLSSTGKIPRAAASNEEELEAEIQRRKEKLLAQAKAALGMQ